MGEPGACLNLHRLPEDCPGRELLELHEKLRETVVHALEVSACRVRLSSDMQSAQARLLAQGVSGVTTAGMINGAVELVSADAQLQDCMLQCCLWFECLPAVVWVC